MTSAPSEHRPATPGGARPAQVGPPSPPRDPAPSRCDAIRDRGLRAHGALFAAFTLVVLSGCPQQKTESPEPPPAIYVDPPQPAPTTDPYRAPDRAPDRDDAACPSCGPRGEPEPEPDGQTFVPSDPSAPSDQPGFKDTLEGIPSEAPAGGRDGVAGAGTCEGGTRQVGESWKVKCNTCSCEPSGEVICTLMACINADGV